MLAPRAARAQDTIVPTVLYSFAGADGSDPTSLVEGSDGNFYGTTSSGGFGYNPAQVGTGFGTVFEITPTGDLTTLYVFAGGADGKNPYGLMQGIDGNFYGLSTETGNNFGTVVFEITPAGELTTIYTSSNSQDLDPASPLVQDGSGNFYGVSYDGGLDYGSIFQITPAGVYTTLYTFNGTTDGGASSGLTVGSDGNFYGVGSNGADDAGTIYQVTPSGVLTTLYTFTGGADGNIPNGLTLGSDGNLYGTTQAGGTDFYGVVFQITNAGQFTVLYTFTGGSDSGIPIGNLVQGSDGDLYGITGGDTLPQSQPARRAAHPASIAIPIGSPTPTPTPVSAPGLPSTVFRVTPAGVLTTLYASATTVGNFIQGSDGNFYGTDDYGANSEGSVFKLTDTPHPAFFTGQAPLSGGVDYLAFPNGNYFGYYAFLSDPNYLYHFDLGYEYVLDAKDGVSGVYLYDFASSDFFYTSPNFPFPYLYDFGLNSVLYYFPDPNNPGHYNTGGVRYFYDFATGTIISK